jgi:hypothetical protein
MQILVIKLLFAPLFIIFTYVIQRKYGARLGGVFMAIPFIVVPILVVLYLQEGRDFFHSAVIGTYSGQIGLLFFVLAFTSMARRFKWYWCLLAATASYALAVLILSPVMTNLWVGMVSWFVIWVAVMKTFKAYDRTESLSATTRWDLPIRVFSALALIFLITEFADQLGPQYSGALAMYPVMTSIMSTFNHYRFGANSSIALMHGLTQYLFVTPLFIFPPLVLFI